MTLVFIKYNYMQSVNIKNLRSLTDTGDVPIKDVNVLVGQNSSGKSTFLRTFLLIRQSILRNTRGPILWYDDSFVDFGSYEESKNRYVSNEEGIQLGFKMKIENDFNHFYFSRRSGLKIGIIIDLKLEIFATKTKDFIRKIEINYEDQVIVLEADSSDKVVAFSINGENQINPDVSYVLHKSDFSGLLPSIFMINKDNNDNSILRNTYSYDKCSSYIKKIINRSKINDSISENIISNVILSSKEDVLNKLKSVPTIKTWGTKTINWDIDTPQFIELNNLLITNSIATIFSSIDRKLRDYFENCQYIAPIRAKAVRYYRRQNLSVSEIDAYGENMHMFLDNLTPSQRDKYQKFVNDVFGFTPEIESNKGHIAIKIKDKNGDKFNITDLGFGFSQILPIITKLWFASLKKRSKETHLYRNRDSITLLIEQPELHLHPSMQAQLADAFIVAIKTAKENKIQLKLIIETHSAVIINRIGRRVVDKGIEPSDVNITLFQPDSENKSSIVKITEFNIKGQLKNWPIGFFEPNN